MAAISNVRRRVAIVGSVGVPAKYGGFETLVDRMLPFLADEFEMHVYCSGKAYTERPREYKNATLHYVDFDANGVSSIAYDVVSMIRAARYCDAIVLLGVSGAAFLPFLEQHVSLGLGLRLSSGLRLGLSLSLGLGLGLRLDASPSSVSGSSAARWRWHCARRGRAAKWFLRFSEAIGARAAHVLIADNEVIRRHLDHAYGKHSHLIAYGGDHVLDVLPDAQDQSRFPFLGERYAVKVCRIETVCGDGRRENHHCVFPIRFPRLSFFGFYSCCG